MRDVKARLWACLFYPEDFESDDAWVSFFDGLHVPVLVSPLHVDSDKPHRHVLFVLDGPIPYSSVVDMVSPLGISHVEKVTSRMSYERYLCHLDSPDKVKYSPDEIVCFGGAYPKFAVDEEYRDGFVQLTKLIESLGITIYADLSSMVAFDYPELIPALTRYSVHFNNYCRSRFDLSRYGDNVSYVKSRKPFGYLFDKE